jgi:hypothetical protein
MLQAHGVTNEMLGRLVIDGLATATPQIVHAGKWPLKVVRMRITDAGRQAALPDILPASPSKKAGRKSPAFDL